MGAREHSIAMAMLKRAMLFYRKKVIFLKTCASKEAGLAQEIRETFFKHLLLYTISVAYGHWASTASATALGVRSPSATPLFSFLPCPETGLSRKGCPETRP